MNKNREKMSRWAGRGLFALIVAGWMGSSAMASVILVNDKFLDGSLANGSDAGETDIDWWAVKNSAGGTTWVVTTGTPSPLSGSAIQNSGLAPNSVMYGNIPLTTLVAGEAIKFEFDMKRSSSLVGQTTDATVEMKLGYDNGTAITDDSKLRGDTQYTDDKVFTTGPLKDKTYFTDTAVHHWVFQLTRQANGSYDQLVTVGGVTAVSNNVAAVTGMNDRFNRVSFLMPVGVASSTAVVDNIQVTVIPEPATIGMLGLGAVITLLLRRKIMS